MLYIRNDEHNDGSETIQKLGLCLWVIVEHVLSTFVLDKAPTLIKSATYV